MTSQRQALTKLRLYASKVNDEDNHKPIRPDEEEAYALELQRSLQSLQNQVRQHELRLETLRATTRAVSIDQPDEDSASHIRQLRTITAAYSAIASTEPLLPSPDSPLPALLALRSSLKLVDETKSSIRRYEEQIISSQRRLRQESSDLGNTRQMSDALERRMDKLRLEKAEMAQMGTEGTIATMLQTRQQRQTHYAKSLKGLVGAFNEFVNKHLATLIAAEQLGGPIVGDNLSIDDETLKSGFNRLGKVRKAKGANRIADDGEGAMTRMDLPETTLGTESKVAGAGFRKLTEELLNALADEENRDSYIAITNESAATRFLVRAKVAQFDPKDARKLRLMDFGAELEDDT